MSAEPLTRAVQPEAHAPPVLPHPRELRFFVRNVMILILVGVIVSWWWLEYTDFFPKVGGFFGLAGIFAWVAFLSDLVTKKRKEQLQDELEQRVLLRPSTATYALFALILFGIWAALHGTLVVIAPGDEVKRVVQIRDGARTIETITVAPGSSVKVSLWTPRRKRDLVVSAAGLPDLGVRIASLSRTKVIVPQSLRTQPALFAHALSGDDRASLGDRPAVLAQIRRGSGPWVALDAIAAGGYAGESLWIGVAVDTEVPADVRRRWLGKELEDADAQPMALAPTKPLRPGDAVRVCVLNNQGAEVGFGEATVLADKQRPFPQELAIKPIGENGKGCVP